MHPPQWTHYQPELCFPRTRHQTAAAPTRVCAHTHKFTNYNPKYGQTSVYTHTSGEGNGNVTQESPECLWTHTHQHTHTHTNEAEGIARCRFLTWKPRK